MINLVIKGSFPEAVAHAMRHDVIIGNLRAGHYHETYATCDEQYLPKVIKWYANDMSLLLYSKSSQ